MQLRRVLLAAALAAALAETPRAARAGEGSDDGNAANGADAAKEILDRAVAAQGGLRHDRIEDVTLVFRGQVLDPEEGEHAIVRTYRYRARDRSFYLETVASAAAARRTERGVFGAKGYWDRSAKGEIHVLRGTHKEDRAAVDDIRGERKRFEQMLEMVALARLQGTDVRLRLAAPEPVTLADDEPFEANGILGKAKERTSRRYHVLDVEREGAPRLRLFVRTGDAADAKDRFTVCKAIQYGAKDTRPDWVFYFGPFRPDGRLGLSVPQYCSVHDAEPSKATTRDTCRLHGEIAITINTGLDDAALRPG
jgi:hypothetical protein